MTRFNWDHIHLRSSDPGTTTEWYQDNLGAEIVRSPMADGSARSDLALTGHKVFIVKAQLGEAAGTPSSPYFGLDHFGLAVSDIKAAVADLKSKGVIFTMDVTTNRPGVQIAFLTAPQTSRSS